MSDDAPPSLDDLKDDPMERTMRARVALPAALLIFVSVLNLVCGMYLMLRATFIKSGQAGIEISDSWDRMDDNARQAFGLTETTFYQTVNMTANVFLGWGAFAALVSVFTLLGARRMRALHSYGLAMAAAVVTAIPCVTPCCLIGQVAGIWAVIVLLQPDVRKAFQ